MYQKIEKKNNSFMGLNHHHNHSNNNSLIFTKTNINKTLQSIELAKKLYIVFYLNLQLKNIAIKFKKDQRKTHFLVS